MMNRKRDGISVEGAVECMLSTVTPMTRVQKVPLHHAGGRVLAKDAVSPINNPPFDRAPVDGYACKAADTKGVTKENPKLLKVLTEVDAGDFYEGVVGEGEAVRIMTGAAIPKGCDCCIRQEATDYGEDMVAVYEEHPAYINYCYAGEDFKKGQCLVKAGTKLTYVEIAVLASMGMHEVPVYEMPRIAILTTGDEIVPPGEALRPGKIYNSNLAGLVARLHELGLEPDIAMQVGDQGAHVAAEIARAAKNCDLVITTGGVSVGKKDILHEALPLLEADQKFWGVALKPGTPTIYSVYQGKPVVSLSGNPFGALTNFELLVRPMLAKMCHDESLSPKMLQGVMASEFLKASHGRRYIRAIYRDGQVFLPEGLHSSGVLSSMQGCNCLVDIKPGTKALHLGDTVDVVLTHREF